MQKIKEIKSDLKEDRIIVIAGILSWILLIIFNKAFCSNALSQTMLALFTFIGALLLPLAGLTIPFIVFYFSDKCDLQEAQAKAKHQHAKKAPADIYKKIIITKAPKIGTRLNSHAFFFVVLLVYTNTYARGDTQS